MNDQQPTDGRPIVPAPLGPNRTFDVSVPQRPITPQPAAYPQRPALDGQSPYRTDVPAYRRAAVPWTGRSIDGTLPGSSPVAPQPAVANYAAPAQPIAAPAYATAPVQPITTPPAPAPSYYAAPQPVQPPAPAPPSLRPMPSQLLQRPLRPAMSDFSSRPSGRPTAPTVYSAEAMLPGQTPEQYRTYLQSREQAKQQHVAETDGFLRQIPPPIDVPPKPVNSKAKASDKWLPLLKRAPKAVASAALFFGLVWGGAALLNTFVFQSYYVDGLSMTPALQNNDRLIISKVERTKAEAQSDPYIPERGQIVVIDGKVSDYTAERHEQLIKRVIGLPGDTVIIQNGIVMIKNKDNPDGFNVDKQLKLDVAPTFTETPMIVTVPDDHVFVLGDNRVNGGSFDSRAFGVVPSEDLLGRLWARILPTDKMSVF